MNREQNNFNTKFGYISRGMYLLSMKNANVSRIYRNSCNITRTIILLFVLYIC